MAKKRSFEEFVASTAAEPTLTVLTADGGRIRAHVQVHNTQDSIWLSIQLVLQGLVDCQQHSVTESSETLQCSCRRCNTLQERLYYGLNFTAASTELGYPASSVTPAALTCRCCV